MFMRAVLSTQYRLTNGVEYSLMGGAWSCKVAILRNRNRTHHRQLILYRLMLQPASEQCYAYIWTDYVGPDRVVEADRVVGATYGSIGAKGD